MSGAPARLDCIYVAASAHDARYTRICVASIRHFYAHVPIRLLPGGPLESGLKEELARYWDVGIANIHPGNWGWGFVKLEPLFGPPGERFLVLDSDAVVVGDVLETWAGSAADFLVDDEQQSESDTRRLYYDWRKIAAIDPEARPPEFVFNSGQWFGTAGVLTRKDFALFVNWSGMPPRLHYPDLFMPGDQGVLNYVVNQNAILGRNLGRLAQHHALARAWRGWHFRSEHRDRDDAAVGSSLGRDEKAPDRRHGGRRRLALFRAALLLATPCSKGEALLGRRQISGRRMASRSECANSSAMANDHGETRKGTTMIPTASQVVEKLPRFFRRHKLMTGWMRLTGENPVQLVRIRDDYFGYADLSDGFLRLIVIDRGLEADFFTIADAILASGGVFLDVGANYGFLSFGLGGRHDGSIRFSFV